MTQNRPPAGLAGTVDHVDAGNGWLVVRLMTRQALVREGEHMQHCLRHGSYHHLAGEEEMTGDAIWSLRDPRGMSRATLDVRSRNVVMAKGKGNSDVGGKAARRLKALVAAFRAAGADLDFAGETGLIVAPNGYVCREEHAPPEVIEAVKARHRAAVEARRERPVTIRNGLFMTLDEVDEDGVANAWRGISAFYDRVRRRERPEPDLLAMTAGLPNPVVEVSTTWDRSCDGLRGRAQLRDGQVADLTAEGNWRENAVSVRRALSDRLYQRVLALQPPRIASIDNPHRGNIYAVTSEPITDVVVTEAGEALREGEDYGVDAACGHVEFRRDVEGQVEVAYRITYDPNREVLTLGIDTMSFRVDENPHRSILEPVYDPILPAGTHQTEITCPEMPGARWVLTTCYGQMAAERAGG